MTVNLLKRLESSVDDPLSHHPTELLANRHLATPRQNRGVQEGTGFATPPSPIRPRRRLEDAEPDEDDDFARFRGGGKPDVQTPSAARFQISLSDMRDLPAAGSMTFAAISPSSTLSSPKCARSSPGR